MEKSRRSEGSGRLYRLRPVELAALERARQRAQATFDAKGTDVKVTNEDVVGAALMVHERVTRGDLVTLRIDAITSKVAALIDHLANETKRAVMADAADYLAKHGLQVNVTSDDLPPVDRAEVRSLIEECQREAFERPNPPKRATPRVHP